MTRADAGTAEADPQRVLLIGAGSLSAAVAEHVRRWGSTVRHLPSPSDEQLRETLAAEWDVVAVVTHDDILALRYALLVHHIRHGIRLLVTIFDRTVGGEVVRSVPNCTVLAMTDALVPALLGPCVAEHLLSLHQESGEYFAVADEHGEPELARLPARGIVRRNGLAARLLNQCRPHDATSRALLAGLAGLASVLLLDVVLGVLVLHESVTEAFWHAARVLTTVGSSDAATHAAPWYHAVSALTMLAALAFAALFTAGLVDRMTSHRLTGIIGGRAVPRRGHVIVVGLGQVGLRLCQELRRLGVGVVAVERDKTAPCVALARATGIPVVIGRGGDRFLLGRLSARRARAIAAVASDPLDNVAVAVAARAVAPDQRIVLRAGGEDDVVSESQSLFRIATVCDINRIGGAFIAATALRLRPRAAFPAGAGTWVVWETADGHELSDVDAADAADIVGDAQPAVAIS